MKRKIKNFQCDGGGEFNSNIFLNHLQICGIKRQITCPYTPKQNGVAERKHRHTTLTIMFQAQLLLTLWVEAFITATYLINIMPLSTLNMKSPFEKLFNKVPDYDKLRTFGCRCFPYLKDYNKNKFNKKSKPCVFVGYNLLHKGYCCLDLENKRVYISRHVVFDENTFPLAKLSSLVPYRKV